MGHGSSGNLQIVLEASANLVISGGNVLDAGYLRVGSTSAPTNTTAGDLTTVRLFTSSTASIGDTLTVTKATGAAGVLNVSVQNSSDGYAGIELLGNSIGWLISKRLSGDSHSLHWYYYNAGYTKLMELGATGVLGLSGNVASTSTTTGTLVVTGGVGVSGAYYGGASVVAHAGTAIPAGGTAGAGLMVSSTANFGVFFGSGAPSLSAAKGSLYLRSDGSGTTDRAYINTNGSTTWTALTTVA